MVAIASPHARLTSIAWPRRMSPWTLVLAAVALLDVVCIAAALWKPIALDFPYFVRAGAGVADSGRPVLYVGENLGVEPRFAWRPFGDSTHELGLWHPPLYVYTLGVFFRLFGTGDVTARLLGVVSLIATTGATMLLARRLAGRRQGTIEVSALAAILLLLNPLTVQYAVLLPDIDGTLLAFLTVVFTYLVLPYGAVPGSCGRGAKLVLGAALAVLLWTKLTTPPLVLAAWLLFHVLKRDWRGVSLVIQVAAIGLTLFVATWLLYCWVLALPPLYPVQHNLSRDDVGWAPGFALVQGLRVARFDLTWLGLPLAALYSWGLWRAIAGRTDDPRGDSMRQLAGAIVLVGYLAYTFGITTSGLLPRYKFPLWPLAAALAAAPAYGLVRQVPRRVWISTASAVTLVAILLPDRLLIAWGRAAVAQVSLEGALKGIAWGIALVLPAAVAVACVAIAIRAHMTTWRWPSIAIVAATLAFIPENAVLSLKQSLASYDTTYRYGQNGDAVLSIAAFLRQRYDPSRDVVYAVPDVAYYWQGRYIDSIRLPVSHVLAHRAARVIVLPARAPTPEPLRQLEPVRVTPDFLVYEIE